MGRLGAEDPSGIPGRDPTVIAANGSSFDAQSLQELIDVRQGHQHLTRL
jgi:hypothetical protein